MEAREECAMFLLLAAARMKQTEKMARKTSEAPEREAVM